MAPSTDESKRRKPGPRVANKLKPLAIERERKYRTRGIYSDGHGLFMRVRPGIGDRVTRAWVFVCHVDGKRCEVGLGSLAGVTLEQARKKAQACRDALAQGDNPVKTQGKRAKLANAPKNRTLEQVITEYCKSHNWSDRYAKQWPASVRLHFAKLLSKNIRDIKAGDIEASLSPIWTTKTVTAKNVKTRLRMLHEFACSKKYAARDVDLWPDVAGAFKNVETKKKKNFAAAPWSAVPSIIRKIYASTTESATAGAMVFGILCASRSGEVRGMRWKEVNTKAAVWTVPAERMKAGKEHRVPLSKAALKILKAQPRGKPDDLIFPGRTGGMLSDMAFTAVLRRLEIASAEPGAIATYHGFRSSFRDWAAETTDIPSAIVEAALAHTVPDEVIASYLRTDYLARRAKLAQQWADHCVGVAK